MTSHIARITTYLFRSQVSEPVKTSFGTIPWRSVLLLRVEDNEGAEGWGEVWCNFPPFSAENKQRLIETVIAPVALGMPCARPDEVWSGLTRKTHRWAVQTGEYGPIAACLAGLDLALWDLSARRNYVPLRVLLNPDCARPSIPVYASGLNPDSALATVDRARSSGFTAFKVKVAFGLERDMATVGSITSRLGGGEHLMVDANQGWEFNEAREAVALMSERQVRWIEEPILADSPAEDWNELAELASSPLAGGENLAGFDTFDDMIQQGSHQVIQPDLLKWGGVTGCHTIAQAVVSKGLTYCPHWLGSAVGLMASGQVLAAVGGNGMLEHDVMDNPLREALIETHPTVEKGSIPLPPGPGIGFVPVLEQAEQWLCSKNSFHTRSSFPGY